MPERPNTVTMQSNALVCGPLLSDIVGSNPRVAANILNKQSRIADTGWSSGLGVGRGANNSSP